MTDTRTAQAAALRAMADEIDRGPVSALPPSVISALVRERADSIEATDPADPNTPPPTAAGHARFHLDRATNILRLLGAVGDSGEPVNPVAAQAYVATAHAEAACGHGWAALASHEAASKW